MMVGHQFLKEEFNIKPEIGWDIDTFGHSDTNTRLFAEMGFDAMFFSRLDHNDKRWRKKKENKAMTFLWRPASSNFGA
jgi:alpha-mannosidase